MRKGFTLIELLIVIAIIAVLAVAFLPSVLNAPAKARDAQRIEDVNKIAKFFTLQYSVKGTLPTSLCINPASTGAAQPGKLINDNLSDFGGVFPKDPDPTTTFNGTCGGVNAGMYWYIQFSQKSNPYAFAVLANVENDENGNIIKITVKDTSVTLAESGDYYVVLGQR